MVYSSPEIGIIAAITTLIHITTMNQKLYGTVAHWFPDMNRGSIIPDQSGCRLFADRQSLSPDYAQPRSGDRVSFYLGRNGDTPTACRVEAVKNSYRDNSPMTIIITEWDLMQNGGFGVGLHNQGQPVFVLGQFLADQTRVPEIGDRLSGTLRRHDNGQWILTDALIEEAEPLPPVVETAAETPPQQIAETFYRAPPQETVTYLPPKQVMSGTITHWDDAKGYGFIRFGGDAQNLFFHISAFHYVTQRPEVGQRVSFYCERPIEGERQKAERVVLIEDEAFIFEDQQPDFNSLNIHMASFLTNSLIAATFLAVVAYFSLPVAILYMLASAVSFFLYRQDKLTAQQTRGESGYLNRTPEKSLHLADLFGGWPGGLIARSAFRHKTRKRSFIIKFWFTVAINIAITYALLIHYADNPLLSMLRN